MKKDIFIILPYKESLKPSFAGAVSLYVKDTTSHSIYKKRIQIISSDDFDNKSELFRNKNYIINFCKKYENKQINIIEIHNRPEYLSYIRNYFPKTKIKLIFHNDPLSLRGSISINDRENIINTCHKVIFISSWIQQRFFSAFKNADLSNSVIIPHGIKKIKNVNLKNKQKNILFVGKLKKEHNLTNFTRSKIEEKIYENYTQYWSLFFKFQIPYVLRCKKVYSSIDSFYVWGLCAFNEALNSKKLDKSIKDIMYVETQEFFKNISKLKSSLGLNPTTISELSGIPRATVIRQIKYLVKKNFLYKENQLYKINNNQNSKISTLQNDNFKKNQYELRLFLKEILNLIKN